MLKRLAVTVITLMCWTANAAEVNIGGVSIRIPTQQGFARVTPDIQPLYDVALGTTHPNNRRLVTFVNEAVIPAALAGEMPTFDRYVNVEVMKKLESINATDADFAKLKRLILDDFEKIIARVEQSLPDKMADMSGRVSETLNFDLAFSMNNVVPLPVHHETERTTSYSMFTKHTVSSDGAEAERVITLTSTILFLKGKILFVYVYGGPNDLAWTRRHARQLVDVIVRAN